LDWHKQTAKVDYDATKVCGEDKINAFLTNDPTNDPNSFGAKNPTVTKAAILNYYTNANGAIAGEEHLAEKHASVVTNKLMSKVNSKDNICLYMRNDYFSTITSAADFWKAFDVFDKQYIIETQVPQANIPESLRGLMADLF